MKNRTLPRVSFSLSILAVLRTLLPALAAGAVLAACGGGGGSGGTPMAGSTPSTTSNQPAAQPSVSITSSASSVNAGQPVTLTWSSQNTGGAACTASGAWSGQLAASGSRQVVPASGATTYSIACGAATGSVAVTVKAPVNTMAMTVDAGPAGANAFNVPFVSVTVCRPGTTVCQTIDHVMVDTGSYGLRLMSSSVASLGLPGVKSTSGADVGECGQFVSGYTWGSIAQADIKLGGETAAAQSVQIIGKAPGSATVPSSCSSVGGDIGTLDGLGANGILGVGLFKEDCGRACVAVAQTATYYACVNGTCTPTTMPLAKQVSNPVAAFASDNNGVILTLPAVGNSGATSLAGTLTFGIGTQSNNGLGSAKVFRADASGNFTTVYKGTRMTSSFIDSGSNGLYFNDTTIAECTLSVGFYCPASPLALSATMMSYDGSTSATVPFTIVSVDKLPDSVVLAPVGGANSSHHSSAGNTFDWGLPFFFGRKVYVGLESDVADPYWAF